MEGTVVRVPEAKGAGGKGQFAALLRELKDRSGLSYGALAKRLHMSTSTLHRYCNGTAVPHDYAPVERLARVCRATPQELMELHRQWILADAARGARPDRATGAGLNPGSDSASAAGSAPAPAPAPDPASDPAPGAGSDSASATGSASEAHSAPEVRPAPEARSDRDTGAAAAPADSATTHAPGTHAEPAPLVVDAPRLSAPPRARRNALTAAVAVAAVFAAVVLAVNVPALFGGGGGGGDDVEDQRGAGATVAATAGTAHATGPVATDSAATPSPSHESGGPSASAPTSTDGSGRTAPGTSKTGDDPGASGPTGGDTAVPFNVATRPYIYDSPCSQHFLVDSAPEQVGPPAGEQDAPRWAAAYGAVSSEEQRVALTVQGTGRDTVVLEALHVRVVSKGAPLAWNDYAMGVGCGGGVDTKSFDIDLDNGSPTVTVKNGQRDFPYSVSESDPEVFYVTAHAKAHDVRWDLSLEWSSGSRRGTVRIDSDGTPFRTSAGAGRPGYDYPLGGGEWIEREG
ncbi:helix-turn-helix domain-containing protein [Streptomyces sp. NPDC012623]|uniref:helix-turn-helix domain-containing protein n=1 Tax=unclassified Streptomyces TaxID=2593676 RepID=UPI003685FDE7